MGGTENVGEGSKDKLEKKFSDFLSASSDKRPKNDKRRKAES